MIQRGSINFRQCNLVNRKPLCGQHPTKTWTDRKREPKSWPPSGDHTCEGILGATQKARTWRILVTFISPAMLDF